MILDPRAPLRDPLRVSVVSSPMQHLSPGGGHARPVGKGLGGPPPGEEGVMRHAPGDRKYQVWRQLFIATSAW